MLVGPDEWSARTPYDGAPIPVGVEVTILEIDGAVAVVSGQLSEGVAMDGTVIGLVVLLVLVLAAVTVLLKSLVLVPQAQAAVIERLGRYTKTVSGQLALLIPFVDRVRARVDLREQVVSFPPQPVITQDNLTLQIDTVVYFQVTKPAGRGVRDQQLHRRRRAAHHHHAAQRGRRHDAGGDAHLA